MNNTHTVGEYSSPRQWFYSRADRALPLSKSLPLP